MSSVTHCFLSDGYTTDDIVFNWNPENPIQRNEDLVLPEFAVTGISTGDCTVEYVTGKCVLNIVFIDKVGCISSYPHSIMCLSLLVYFAHVTMPVHDCKH